MAVIKEFISPKTTIFTDGILYIMSRAGNIKAGESYSLDVMRLDPEYDDPICLDDISKLYPNVFKVVFDQALGGVVYNYKNHPGHGADWEKVGTTTGYA